MTITLKPQRVCFIFTAPSGAGKTTICRELIHQDPTLAYSVSSTTREPRPGEEQGEAYDFLTEEEFGRLREEDAFLESAEVHGRLYGTRRDLVEDLMEKGCDVILDLDVQGAMQVRDRMDRVVLIFILPPSMATLEKRLRRRASDDEEAIQLRLQNARDEIARAGEFDYAIVNDDVYQAVAQARSVVAAERIRLGHQRIVCEGEGDLDAVYTV